MILAHLPALLTDYCLSICSADYNEWIWKTVDAAAPRDLPGEPVALPAAQLDRLARPLSTVLPGRSSSFGRFRRPPDLTRTDQPASLVLRLSRQVRHCVEQAARR